MPNQGLAAVSRPTFLRAGGAALALGLSRLQWACEFPPATSEGGAPATLPSYRPWNDLYREKWIWDAVARGTHTKTNCVSGCSWELFVKDGMV
jgi:nitrate reductase alpha subunit